jgi:hypothetical protein
MALNLSLMADSLSSSTSSLDFAFQEPLEVRSMVGGACTSSSWVKGKCVIN